MWSQVMIDGQLRRAIRRSIFRDDPDDLAFVCGMEPETLSRFLSKQGDLPLRSAARIADILGLELTPNPRAEWNR